MPTEKKVLLTAIIITVILFLSGCPISINESKPINELTPINEPPPAIYGITLSPKGAEAGESVSVDISEAKEGTAVTITASLNSNRRVALSSPEITATPEAIISDGGSATFSVPAGDVEIAAVFYSVQGVETGNIVGDIIGDSTGTPGDLITFRINYSADSDTIPDLVLADQLPAGIAFYDIVTVTRGNCITAYTPESETYSIADGAEIDFDFGYVEAVDGNDPVTISLDFRARILNAAANVIGHSLVNSVSGEYGSSILIPDSTTPVTSVTIKEPLLQITTDLNEHTIRSGDEITYTITVDHTAESNAAAYDLVCENSLPEGLTLIDPLTDGLDNDGDGAVDGADGDGEIAILAQPGYTLLTMLRNQLATGSPGQTWTMTYRARADKDLHDGLVLSNTVDVRWDGQDDSWTEYDASTERDGSDGPAGLNDYRTPTSSAVITISQPIINFIKVLIDENSPPLEPGDIVRFEITIQNTSPTRAASSIIVTDLVPAELSFISGSITVDGGPIVDGLGDGADYNITAANTITVNVDPVRASESIDITFRGTVKESVEPGTIISNTASIISDQYSISDSNTVYGTVE